MLSTQNLHPRLAGSRISTGWDQLLPLKKKKVNPFLCLGFQHDSSQNSWVWSFRKQLWSLPVALGTKKDEIKGQRIHINLLRWSKHLHDFAKAESLLDVWNMQMAMAGRLMGGAGSQALATLKGCMHNAHRHKEKIL